MSATARKLDSTLDINESQTQSVTKQPAPATPEQIQDIENILAPLTADDALDPDDVLLIDTADNTQPKVSAKARTQTMPPPLPSTNKLANRTSTPPPIPADAVRRPTTIPAPAPTSLGTRDTQTNVPQNRPSTPPATPLDLASDVIRKKETLAAAKTQLENVKSTQAAIEANFLAAKVDLTPTIATLHQLAANGIHAKSLADLQTIRDQLITNSKNEGNKLIAEGKGPGDSAVVKAINSQIALIDQLLAQTTKVGQAKLDMAISYQWNAEIGNKLNAQIGTLQTELARQEPVLAKRRLNEAQQFAQKYCDEFMKKSQYTAAEMATFESTKRDVLDAVNAQKGFIDSDTYDKQYNKIVALFEEAATPPTKIDLQATPPPIPVAALRTSTVTPPPNRTNINNPQPNLPPVPVSTHRDAIVPEPRTTAAPAPVVATSPAQVQVEDPEYLTPDEEPSSGDPFSSIDNNFTIDAPKKGRWEKAVDWAKNALSRSIPDEAQLARTVSNRLDKYPNLTDEARAQIQSRILAILTEDTKKSPTKLRKLVDNAVKLHEETMKKFRESLAQKPMSETDLQINAVRDFVNYQLEQAQKLNATINEASIVPQAIAKLRKINGLSPVAIAQMERNLTAEVRYFNQAIREARVQEQVQSNIQPIPTAESSSPSIPTDHETSPAVQPVDQATTELAQLDALADKPSSSPLPNQERPIIEPTQQNTTENNIKNSTETTKTEKDPRQLEFNFNLSPEQSEAKIQAMAESIIKKANEKEFKAGKLYAFDDLADMYERNGKPETAEEIRNIRDSLNVPSFNSDGTVSFTPLTRRMMNDATYDIQQLQLPAKVKKALFRSLSKYEEDLERSVMRKSSNGDQQLGLDLAA